MYRRLNNSSERSHDTKITRIALPDQAVARAGSSGIINERTLQHYAKTLFLAATMLAVRAHGHFIPATLRIMGTNLLLFSGLPQETAL